MAKSKGKAIRGVTIELGGDASKLLDEFYAIDAEVKKTQAALKDTNRLLKLDPGNVELLKQKQGQLNDAIKGTEDKLKALKDAAAEAEQQLADGTMSQAQFDALQREIVDTEQSLKNLKGEMSNFGSVAAQQLAAAGQKVKDLGDKLEKAGTALSKTVTAPIVAVGTAAVAAFTEVDDGLDIIVKKTGASGKALEDMEDAAKNLATSIPTDFRTAGEAVGEVNTRFGLVGDALESTSRKFIEFADLNDTSVSASIDSVQAAMAAFNVDADKAGAILDILNKAGQDTGTSLDKLAGDLTSNAAALQEMGFGISSATGFLANLNKSGLDSSAVLTGLKKALQNATKDGVSMDQALAGLNGKIKGAKTQTEALQIATDLFGAKAAPTMVKAIQEGRISFDQLANSIKDWNGSVESTFEATLDPIDEFKTTLNELKIVGMELVEAAAPLIKSLAEGLKNAVSGLRSAWEGLSPQMQETIIKLAGVAAAVGPVLAVVGKLTDVIGGIMTKAPQIMSIIGTLKGAISGLWGLIAAHPIVAAAAAAVGLFTLLYTKCEGFRNFINGFVSGIVNVVTGAIEGIKTAVSRVGDALQQTVNDNNAKMQAAYEEHGGGMEGIAAATWEGIKAKYTFGFDFLNNLTGGKLDGIKQMWEDLKGKIIEKAGEAIRGAIQAFNQFGDYIVNLKNSALNWGRDLIQNFINGIKQMWENAKRTVSDFAQMIKNFLGFSEPKEGPLSNFHTYAPDMVDLFVRGLRDNQQRVANQLARTFAMPETGAPTAETGGGAGGATTFTTPVGGAQAAPQTPLLVLDGQVIGRVFYPHIQAEEIRLGVQLAR